MVESYRRLKSMVGEDNQGRANFIQDEVKKFGYDPTVCELGSPRGIDRHVVVKLDNGGTSELWLTANYDTLGKLPSANNNSSGVVALLGVAEYTHDDKPPVNLRLVFFDAGLDPDLVHRKRRNPNFTPGSEIFVRNMMDNEIDFIEEYAGALAVQAVGKGELYVFERTGKKGNNSKRMNEQILDFGKAEGIPIALKSHSPHADNESFTREGLEATVIARYHEGSWHRMQTKGDDLNNINIQDVESTIEFLHKFTKSYQGGDKT